MNPSVAVRPAGAETRTLVDLLRARGSSHPASLAFTFLRDGDEDAVEMRYGDLDRRACAIAAVLQECTRRGDRVLLLHAGALEFIASFCACLYAGVIAVPSYPPRPHRTDGANGHDERLRALLRDAQPAAVLASADLVRALGPLADRDPAWTGVARLATDTVGADMAGRWRPVPLEPDDAAFLQYTSGSTSLPRGVVVSHANLMHNQRALHDAFAQSADSVIVGWLPLYHDMGLIGNVLHTLYLGASCVLMPPLAFLQRPARWLRAISRFRATVSGGPNFAYDLCVRRVDADDRRDLDLSSWAVAFNGAEPVQAATLERFSAAFAGCGFTRGAFQPCYGLAEATLMVTASRRDDRPTIRRVRRDALEAGRAIDTDDGEGDRTRALVSCGTPDPTQEIAIVDPVTGGRTPAGCVGEIWVAGPGVAREYWANPDETARVFDASCGDTAGFLRTGDLGTLCDGELYVTGRLKDLVILRGRNLDPHDLESTVERSHPALRPGCGVACSIEVGGEERLVVVHEVRERVASGELEAVCQAMRRSLVKTHDVDPFAIALVAAGRVPKTSSGKLQRRLCRAQFVENRLDALFAWTSPAPAAEIADDREVADRDRAGAPAADERDAVRTALVRMLSRIGGVPASRIDPRASIVGLGFDSLRAAELQGAIERTFGARVQQAALLEAPTLDALVTLILDERCLPPPGPPASEASDAAASTDERVSHGQRALWFLQQMAPESAAYHIARAGRVRGRLHASSLERALRSLVERHGALRAGFATVDGEPVQRLQPAAVDFAQVDAAGWSEADVRQALVDESTRPFDLSNGPLLRARVLTRSAGEHVLLLVVHHIAADLWSLTRLMRELGVLYAADVADMHVALPPLELDHAEYVRWHHDWMRGRAAARAREWWQRTLDGVPPLDLPVDRRRPPLQTFRGETLRSAIAPPLAAALADLAREQGATLQMALLAAFQTLLGRYAAQERFAVASPAAGRTSAALHGVVGYLVNPLALAADLRGDPSFLDVLGRVRRIVTASLHHQLYPFDAVVDALRPVRDPSRPPLAQVMFVYQAAPGHDGEWARLALGAEGAHVEIGALALESVAVPETTAQFELTLAAAGTSGGVELVWQYNSDLFERDTVARMAASFGVLVEAVVADPSCRLAALPLLSSGERATILHEWNATAVAYPEHAVLHGLIAAQVARTPSAPALVSGGDTWTYEALDGVTTRLARALRTRGVGPDVVVAVCMERSPDLVFALLATLKAGGAYLPLDPSHPPDRLRLLLREAGAQIVVTHERVRDRVPDDAAATVCDLQALLLEEPAGDGESPRGEPGPDTLAYVIYTSGSTGAPKGVMISHRAICNRLFWMQDQYALGPADAVLQKTTFAFDVSVWEFFWPLMTGARLVLAGPDDHRDSARLVELIAAHGITTIHFVPSMLPAFVGEPRLPACTTLARIICSGEALPADLARQCAAVLPAAAVHNLYGPTEAAVDVTAWQAESTDLAPTVPIGRPIANVQIHLLDRHLACVPVGVPGELHIGGVGLARGYRHRPGLTADRFIPNPYAGADGGANEGSRLYRTGDLARYRADGAIEFLGRRDDQVKVRGFRIELAEVEAALGALPGVRECAVALRATGSGSSLVGYVVPATTQVAATALRRALAATLPDYMVPHVIMPCESLPVTSSGKLDRKALPAPPRDRQGRSGVYVAPSTPAEETLAAVWSTVLDVDRVGVSDNFFELGGDSIRALQVTSLARARGLTISLQQIFQHQTLAELSHVAVDASAPPSAAPAPFSMLREEDRANVSPAIEDAYPLTMLQAGLVFHSEYQPDYVIYCVSADLRAPFDEAAMHAALAHVIARHPILRTSYELASGAEPFQMVHASAPVPLTVDDISARGEHEQEAYLDAWIEQEKRRRFDWSIAPLIRVHMIRRGPARVQFNLSHPLLDGWSTASLITELFESYFAVMRREPLTPRPLATAYADFVALERQALASDACRDYWHGMLDSGAQGTLPRWPAPPRDAAQLPVRHTFHVPREVLDGVARAARLAAVPLKSAFVAVHARVLATATGDPTVLTGAITNGRVEGPDGDRVLGLFLNTMPLRMTVEEGTWLDLLRRVFATERDALPYRRYPFAELQRLNGGHPPFETAINIINFHVYDRLRGITELELLNRSTSYDQTFFPLTSYFELDVFSSSLLVHLDVNAPDLGDDQIQAMGGYYLRALEALARDPHAGVYDRPLIGPDEERRLLALNDTATGEEAICVHELFERQAARRPAAVAVLTARASLTYAELNARANQLARHLRALGVGHDDLVGLCIERTEQALVGIFGIMKAGAAYVPLDPAFPPDRLAQTTEDAALRVIVTQAALVDRVPGAARRVCLDADAEALALQSSENLALPLDPASRIYVIYTSGSTGRPKGVEVSHRSVANLTASFERELAFDENDVMPAIATFSFDMSILELYLQFRAGACLVLVDRDTAADADRLAETIRTTGITVMQATPSMWRMLLDAGWRGSRRLRAMSGGEALPRELAVRLKERCPRLRNVYGPTETTCWSTSGAVSEGDEAVTIGRPIANTQVYVLDRGLRPHATGVPGRLFIGGHGVARGYLRRPALTASRFVPDPFASEPGARMYDTGDRARWLPDGTIDFLGRADDQIKVRGFRIELGEIEATLVQSPGVRQAVVVAQEYAAGDVRLIASLVCEPDAVPAWSDLRRFLLSKLPDYMVPAGFVVLDALPVTHNGKINRRALARLARVEPATDEVYEEPRSPLERQLAAIWSDVLRVPRVGLRDSFYALGGHSLLAMQIVSRVRARVEPRLPLSALLEGPTIAQFAGAIERLNPQVAD